ncbi:MAG: glycosyltransferase family 39 protein [Candidatus Woesearchaeota archaeon]
MNNKYKKINISKEKTMLLLIILFFCFSNIIWIYYNKVPPMWDQSHYLYFSELLYESLIKENFVSFYISFLNSLGNKAPLMTVIPLPFYLILGKSYKVALLTNLLFLIIGNIYLYKFAKFFTDGKGAISSIIVFNTFPLIFGLSREFLVDYGLTVFVIIWSYYIVKLNTFNDKRALILGFIGGAGILMKVTFPLFIIFPTIYLFIKNFNRTNLKSISINILLVIFIIAILAAPWYISNYKSLLNFITSASFGKYSKYYSSDNFHYYLNHINYGISFYFFILTILIIIILILKRNTLKRKNDSENTMPLYFLFIWLVIPLFTFSLINNKDIRLLTPVYPIFAIFLGKHIYEFFFNKFRLLYYILILLSITNYIFISFCPIKFEKKLSNFVLINNNLEYAHPPFNEIWPNKKIIDLIYNKVLKDKKNYALVTLLFDHPYLNGLTLNYLSKNMSKNLKFTTNDFFHNENINENILNIRLYSNFVLTKSQKLGNESLLKNTPTIDMLNRPKIYFIQIYKLYLPDDSHVIIYKNVIN